MTTRRRIAVWLIVIAGCLSAAVVLLVLLFFNPNHYRPEAISYLEEKTGKKVEIERLTVTFFPKVTVHIDGFGVKSPPLFPPSYIVKVPRADAVLDSWALLHRKVVIRSLMLEARKLIWFRTRTGRGISRIPGRKIRRVRFLSEWSRGWKSSVGS
jgi:uncharacterized protein involved in outer membrane biogenesis